MLEEFVYIMVANGKVVPLNLRLSRTQLRKMRVVVLLTDFSLFFLLCIFLAHSGTTVAAETCAPEYCVSSSDKCIEVSDKVCQNPGDSCCGIIKSEFATLCEQHGGICRSDFCADKLQRTVTNCAEDEVCCILVT